ncbi:MAG: molecular chaperone HtpG, partial [Candidatus Poribacteria bacterium]
KLNTVISKRFIKMLLEKAKKDPEQYGEFFEVFGRFIKEGVASDFANKESLGKLLRFESSTSEAGKTISLEDYVSRLPEEQREIYYISAPNREAAEGSPYYEAFKVKSQEVLFFYDPWDEFVADHLMEFDGRRIVAAEKAEIEVDAPAEEAGDRLSEREGEELTTWIKETLGESVNEVRISKRLVDSPAVIVDGDKFMTASMRRMMKSVNPDGGGLPDKIDLEINPSHNMIVQLNKRRADDADLAAKVTEQIYDNCRATAGLLEDPRAMIQRMNELLEQTLSAKG